jgi:hypothetical protein
LGQTERLNNRIKKCQVIKITDHKILGAGLPMILQDIWTRDPSKPVTLVKGSYTTGACSGSSANTGQGTTKSHKQSHFIGMRLHTATYNRLLTIFADMPDIVYKKYLRKQDGSINSKKF